MFPLMLQCLTCLSVWLNCAGHGDARWQEAVTEQAATLSHVSNLFHTVPQVSALFVMCGCRKNAWILRCCCLGCDCKHSRAQWPASLALKTMGSACLNCRAACGKQLWRLCFEAVASLSTCSTPLPGCPCRSSWPSG